MKLLVNIGLTLAAGVIGAVAGIVLLDALTAYTITAGVGFVLAGIIIGLVVFVGGTYTVSVMVQSKRAEDKVRYAEPITVADLRAMRWTRSPRFAEAQAMRRRQIEDERLRSRRTS